MFGSVTLDVLIGLVLIFFLVSVACSAAVELLSARLKWRQRTLHDACFKLLGDEDGYPDAVDLLNHPLVLPSTQVVAAKNRFDTLAASFGKRFQRPTPQRITEGAVAGDSTPAGLGHRPRDERQLSYLSAQVFADVMIDLLG